MSSWAQSWGSQQGYNGWSWHHGSWDKRGRGKHGDKWWKCKNCATDNKSNTACAIWGLRRSYAEVAKQAMDQSPKKRTDGKQGNTVRQHLEEVACKLAAEAAGRDSHQPMEVQANDVHFKAGKAKLAKLEAALRAMPEDDEDFANERAAITAKIAEQKRHGREQAYLCAHRRSQKTSHMRAAASEGSGGSLGDGSASRRGVRRGDRMHRMRIARLGSCACTRSSGASRDLYGQHCRRSQWTVTTTPGHLQRGSWGGPQPGVSCHSSLCTAHRGVSTCLRGSGTATRSSSGPAEEDAREAIPESPPTSATHVDQNEDSGKTS